MNNNNKYGLVELEHLQPQPQPQPHLVAEMTVPLVNRASLTTKQQQPDDLERIKREQDTIRMEKERIEMEKEKLRAEAEQLKRERELMLAANAHKHRSTTNLPSNWLLIGDDETGVTANGAHMIDQKLRRSVPNLGGAGLTLEPSPSVVVTSSSSLSSSSASSTRPTFVAAPSATHTTRLRYSSNGNNSTSNHSPIIITQPMPPPPLPSSTRVSSASSSNSNNLAAKPPQPYHTTNSYSGTTSFPHRFVLNYFFDDSNYKRL